MLPKDITDKLLNATPQDVALVEKAYYFAEGAHKEHKRNSGEPYFVHLYETAKTLAELGMSATTVAAGLLHDSIEDAGVTPETIEKEFGKDILFIVDGVTKLGHVRYRGSDRHNESLRKLFVAMSKDIRVLIVKLADRLHNMRTLSYVPKEKQERIARETMEVYVPIAYRLGIRKLHRELEDLCFPFIDPEAHRETESLLKRKRKEMEESLEKFLRNLKKTLGTSGITQIKTDYRIKGLFSLYRKLRRKKEIENIYDILALRVVVPTVGDCYRALGAIHSTWRPLPGRIKDFIAFPKPNGYRAIHTTVFTGDRNIVEIQIKTEEMHRESEYGIASHLRYKAKIAGRTLPLPGLDWIKRLITPQPIQHGATKEDGVEDVPNWIRDLVDYQKHESDGEDEWGDQIKSDFFSHRIFVFTPEGDVIDLPIDSTPIDFAYAIHSEIGGHISGARINGKMISLGTTLHNGDIVEIVTKKNAKPSSKWLEYAKTASARRKIRSAIQENNNHYKK
ncbi:MAG: hypothetical protein COV34_01470 [Candidatus Zambryskibacteria bacterium CG10_big_fil_rev_8_21_14_0_10_42_12]|uniref:TGS domain-containing protein n=1 Tax=Candidatus Zambryskibacteria bacterium CG10_big_fil_rev_8_21_14_0_10_42_12 TaxID=1975115 RepID=A0A2H0QVE6_9BACT|nr:MAG: hypothetical protein COV34_01470 [Candidatus Zambryskibacteria bacterium CG10_big_fil_rev_8_21_14_0_10_42_12]